MSKTQESKLLQKLNILIIPEPGVYTSINDIGQNWHMTALTIDREMGKGTTYTWGDYAEKQIHFVQVRHKNDVP